MWVSALRTVSSRRPATWCAGGSCCSSADRWCWQRSPSTPAWRSWAFTCTAEGGGKLDMGRPAELADRLHPVEAVAAVAQGFRVAGEGGGVARDVGDARGRGGGKLGDLLPSAGAGRIEDHGFEAAELRGGEGAAEEVAMVDEQLALGRVGGGLERQGDIARGFGGKHPAFQGEREGAEAGEQVGDDTPLPHRLAHRGDQRRLPLARGLQEGARREGYWNPAEGDRHRLRLPAGLG